MLADERRFPVTKASLAGAGAERLTVLKSYADVVLSSLSLVGNFVEVRLCAADGLRLGIQPLGCLGELLTALDLNHGALPFSLVMSD